MNRFFILLIIAFTSINAIGADNLKLMPSEIDSVIIKKLSNTSFYVTDITREKFDQEWNACGTAQIITQPDSITEFVSIINDLKYQNNASINTDVSCKHISVVIPQANGLCVYSDVIKGNNIAQLMVFSPKGIELIWVTTSVYIKNDVFELSSAFKNWLHY